MRREIRQNKYNLYIILRLFLIKAHQDDVKDLNDLSFAEK